MAKKDLSYEQLRTAFEHQNFEPLYFLYGEETFLIDELQALLIEEALAPGERDFNLDKVYGAETDAQSVLNLCTGLPAMAERRVVIVRDFHELADNRAFKDYAEQPNPQAVVLLTAPKKPNLSAHPYRALRRHAASGHFEPLYDNQMPGWITERLESQGFEIEPKAAKMLADFVGTDLRRADNEIEKLITFAGQQRPLTTDDVVRASGQTREFNVFELQEALGEGRAGDAFQTVEHLLEQANNPKSEAIKIVAMLNAYFAKLWKLWACRNERLSKKALAGRIGVPPFFVSEYKASLRRYDRTDIERAFSALLAADYELKGGARRDARLVMTLLLRRLTPANS
jgi:DNA polymerase-3 subunit delta